MYQRYVAVTIARSQRNAAQNEHKDATRAGIAVRGGTSTKRKIIIWFLVVLQVFFVGCFWLFQLENIVHINSAARQTDERSRKIEPSKPMNLERRINFIEKNTRLAIAFGNNEDDGINSKYQDAQNFRKDFILINNINRLIKNETGVVMSMSDIPIWCYREGTVNETNNLNYLGNDENEVEETPVNTCICQTDWHGKDCGQPEVIWRTLLTSKQPIQLQEPSDERPEHKLVYMLDGNFFSLDFLELQIKTVSKAVDYFIINVNNKSIRSKIKSIERRLRDILKRGQYFLNYCKHLQHPSANKSEICTPLRAYNLIKNLKQNIKPTDIFIYTNDRVILNSKALKFMKYYYKADADFAIAMSFRLKYVVYGFYWQHPQKTYISGFMSSFATLDNPNGGNGDPRVLLQKLTDHKIPTIIIGDLNHFGGWFCKYCFHPEEIITELNTVSNSTSHVHFPNGTRSRQIDVNYMQKLIAQGRYIDSKLDLIKLRRYTDKYYAPEFAEKYNWKYGSLLVNLYVSLEEDIEDEGEY